MTVLDRHPYPPFVPDGAESLIIGSIPPHRFCVGEGLFPEDVDFFYGSRNNAFWKLLGEVFGCSFLRENSERAVLERKRFLAEHRLGITDILVSCLRTENSSDRGLKDAVYLDLAGLLKAHSSICRLFYTSDFVRLSVERSLQLRHTGFSFSSRKCRLPLNGRDYDVLVLYSPSPQALKGLGKGGAGKRLSQYRELLLSGWNKSVQHCKKE